jgi:hypothetical protein
MFPNGYSRDAETARQRLSKGRRDRQEGEGRIIYVVVIICFILIDQVDVLKFCCSKGEKRKKEEFPGFMKTCCLGTPFPRSALFLYIRLWKTMVSRKST